MKSRFFVMLSVVMALTMLLTGCGKDAATVEEDNGPLNSTIYQGAGEGMWYMLSVGINECLNKTYPGSSLELIPGSSLSNAMRLGSGEGAFGMTHGNIAFEVLKGIGESENPAEHITAVCSFYVNYTQIVMRSDFPYDTFDEIINNKVKININIGEPGNASYIIFERLLEFYGLTIEDLEDWGCKIYKSPTANMLDMFSDKTIDGTLVSSSIPNVMVTQFISSDDIKMIELSQDAVDYLSDTYGYSVDTLESSAYDFMDHDMPTIASNTMLAASDLVPEDDVYKLVKSIAMNIDYFNSIHASVKGLTPELMAEGLTIPLHPGALKYYKEAGIID